MAVTFNSPGVYVQEIQKLPASVAQVATAIPAFIGYTEKTPTHASEPEADPGQPVKSVRINSLLDFETVFGGPPAEDILITVDKEHAVTGAKIEKMSPFKLYYALKMFYANGGGACHILSVGIYNSGNEVKKDDLMKGLDALEAEDEPTLIVLPEAVYLNKEADIYELYKKALEQCNKLQDRFAVLDTVNDKMEAIEELRNGIGVRNLKYGAAYYPWIKTNLNYHHTNSKIRFEAPKDADKVLTGTLEELLKKNKPKETTGRTSSKTKEHDEAKMTPARALTSAFLKNIREEIDQLKVTLPPSSAIAGVYATVDRERGVWKAPANTSLNAVNGPTVKVTSDMQESMNVDPDTGKSVNAIRSFFGKGTLVWGARTLAGNDNEWRYINVRRFYNMVEDSVKKSISWVVFEPNQPNTWVRVRAMIENYLTGLWRQGALVGANTQQAFYVSVGLGTTMTSQDILEGRMNVEIGLATSRPAEFVILKFSHKLQEA